MKQTAEQIQEKLNYCAANTYCNGCEHLGETDCMEQIMFAAADHIAQLEAEVAELKEAERWIPVEERLPETEEKVEALLTYKKRFDIADFKPCYEVACLAHVGLHEITTEDWRDYEGEVEYDEENDCYWVCPCWYEVNVVDDNPNWSVDNEYIVTHWRPLPKPPEAKGE